MNNFFSCIKKKTDPNNICESIVFKTIRNKKYEDNFFESFLFQNLKMCISGGHPIFF